MNEPVRWGNARGVPAAGPPGAAAAAPAPAPAGGAVGEAHQALLNVQGPSGFQPYIRPKYFHLRVCVLRSIVYVIIITVSYVGKLQSSYPKLFSASFMISSGVMNTLPMRSC